MPWNAANNGPYGRGGKRLVRHDTDSTAEEIRTRSGLPNTASMIANTKTLCRDQGNVKTRIRARVEKLAEMDMD
ncbi:unnamed protein product, partial [Amoebophrya sp. A25]|eukprot:GSA25T00026587001.1